jgi:hypothetical protein
MASIPNTTDGTMEDLLYICIGIALYGATIALAYLFEFLRGPR